MKYGVGAIIFNEKNEILLMYRGEKCEFYSDCWFLPVGKSEENEEPEDAVVREVREETSLEVQVGKKVWRCINQRGITEVAYLCKVISGIAINVEGIEKCRELGYFPLDNLPREIHEKVIEIIESLG